MVINETDGWINTGIYTYNGSVNTTTKFYPGRPDFIPSPDPHEYHSRRKNDNWYPHIKKLFILCTKTCQSCCELF